MIIKGITGLVIIVSLLVGYRIFLNLIFPEKELKNTMVLVFKENFNKAVKFEGMRLDFFGNLVVKNFNMSVSSDFNDNISLIKSKKFIISFKISELLRRQTLIDRVSFRDTEITVFKKYGKSYKDFIHEIFLSGKPYSGIQYINKDGLLISVSNGRLYYVEVLRNDRLKLEIRNFRGKAFFNNRKVHYKIAGKLTSFKSREISKGNLELKGEMDVDDKGTIVCSRNQVNIENLDISYFNPFIEEYGYSNIQLFGGISLRSKVDYLQKDIGLSGTVEMNNLNVLTANPEGSYNFVSNENMSVDFIVEFQNNFERLLLRKLVLHDNNFRLDINGILCSSPYRKYFDISFTTSRIDLSDLSENFSHTRNVRYGGRLKAQGRCFYDFIRNDALLNTIKIDLEDFNIQVTSGKNKKYLIRDLNAKLTLHDALLRLAVSCKKNNSDMSITAESYVSNLDPLVSTSVFIIKSDIMQAGLIAGICAKGIDRLFDAAYKDRTRGYEDIFFLAKPLGKFMSANYIELDLQVKTIPLVRNAMLRNLVMKAALKDGNLRMDKFSLEGYDAGYTFDLNGYFKTDHPQLNVKGAMNGFDLNRFYRDTGYPGEVEGVLNAEGEFEVNGYRLSHLLEYGKGNLDVRLGTGKIINTPFQSSLISSFKTRTGSAYSLKKVDFTSAAITLNHLGENFYIRNFMLNGDSISFNSYGTYNYFKGLSVPMHILIEKEGEEVTGTGKKTALPALLKGGLLEPLLVLMGVKERPEISIFKIN